MRAPEHRLRFLLVRRAFTEMNPEWSSIAHKGYPDILGGQVKKRLKAERSKALRSNDAELLKKIDGALRAIPELSKIMIEAYAVRIVADYQPGVQVNFDNGERFSLNAIAVSKAHEWHAKIGTLIGSILSAWQQFDA